MRSGGGGSPLTVPSCDAGAAVQWAEASRRIPVLDKTGHSQAILADAIIDRTTPVLLGREEAIPTPGVSCAAPDRGLLDGGPALRTQPWSTIGSFTGASKSDS